MAKKKPQIDKALFPLEPEQRGALAAKMIDSAYRRPNLEPVMMQLARTAGMSEVEHELERMRKYLKRVKKGK